MLFSACSKEVDRPLDRAEGEQGVEQPQEDAKGTIQGLLTVKITEELYSHLNIGTLRSGNSEVDTYLVEIGAKRMTPVFTNLNPEFDKRHKKAGLHLWYTIEFDPAHTVTRAVAEASTLPGVQYAEPVYEIVRPQEQVFIAPPSALRASTATGAGIPNDVRFPEQWHLQNTVQVPGFVQGTDVNAVEAWKQGVTGDPRVIVAVLDGGVQVDHPDIVANLWVNPKPEADKNGDKDEHGRNFNDDVNAITPDNHGTHVAGLIAAVRNNKIGVAGVAGGNGSKDSGVRIMSCQIFSEQNRPIAVANAFVYAADHGAVLANNSWGIGGGPGQDIIPRIYTEAIDYFIEHAGCDNDGNQLKGSMMKGGVALFAAGNYSREEWYMPANYSKVIAVASVGPTASKAVYSNYGVWADIAAPGGDMNYGNPEGLTLSTITEGMYGYMQGTSQATPMVTGVAALIVSKFGGEGFTNEELKQRLLGALRPFDIDARSPGFEGKIGAGIADAGKALAENKKQAPETVSAPKVEPSHDEVVLKWAAVKDPDDGSATYYNLYISEGKPLNEGSIKGGMKPVKLNALEYPFGKTAEYHIGHLKLNTKYYFAVEAVDRWGLKSKLVYFDTHTLQNHLPELSMAEGTKVVLKDSKKMTVEVAVVDKDGHQWNYQIKGTTNGVTHRREGDKIIVDFRKALQPGAYHVTLVVSDKFGASTLEIPFTVVGANQAPVLSAQQPKVFLPMGKEDFSLTLAQYFSDPEGDALQYEVRSTVPQVATAVIADGKLTAKGLKMGTTHIEVTARDSFGAKTRLNFDLQVVKDDIVYVVYPVPVAKDLNIRLSDEVYSAQITILSPMGAQKMRRFVKVREDEDRQVVLNVSELEIGSYVLEVTANGKVFKQNIIKN